MSGSRKLLVVGSLAVAFWSMGYGIFYAAFVEHQMLEGLGSALTRLGLFAPPSTACRSPQSALAEAAQRRFVYVRQVDAHGHWGGLALLLLILGIGFDRVAFAERTRFSIALALLAWFISVSSRGAVGDLEPWSWPEIARGVRVRSRNRRIVRRRVGICA